MEPQQFEGLTRFLAGRSSRRKAIRCWSLTGFVVGLIGAGLTRPAAVAAGHCLDEGCACWLDEGHPCDVGLICCAELSYLPGIGICQTPPQCTGYGHPGDPCPSSCLPGPALCPSCVSGFCTVQGSCR